MIMERGARPDAFPQPKRSGVAWAGVVGVGVGLVFGVGLGVGLGANFALVGALGATHPLKSTGAVMSARERFRLCSLTEAEADPSPSNEELEAMPARWRARGAEPKWGTP
jgi:hypothetical protein